MSKSTTETEVELFQAIHVQIPHSTAVATLQVGVPLRVLRGYFDTTVIGATVHAVAAEYLQRYSDLQYTNE